MRLQLIRNATLRLTYAGKELLIDPYLAPKHSQPPFAGLEDNPTTDLPVAAQAVLEGVELTLVSHLHPDHFDEVAQATLPKTLPLLCQVGDKAAIQALGFGQVTALGGPVVWEGITFSPTLGQHGSGLILEHMGSVMGFVLQAAGEPTVYWAGDTILYPPVLDVIRQFQPDVIITHSGGATLADTLLIMDATQTVELCRAAPDAVVVATHMESLDHCVTSRAHLRAAATQAGVSPDRLHIPTDGETIQFG